MKVSEAIRQLEAIMETHGDLPIVGGNILDDTIPRQFLTVNADGEDIDTIDVEDVRESEESGQGPDKDMTPVGVYISDY